MTTSALGTEYAEEENHHDHHRGRPDHADRGSVALPPQAELERLLPERAEMMLTQLTGAQSRNRTEFSHWLQYVGESMLKFEDAPSGSTSPDSPLAAVASSNCRLYI